jgi:hypothetical protein
MALGGEGGVRRSAREGAGGAWWGGTTTLGTLLRLLLEFDDFGYLLLPLRVTQTMRYVLYLGQLCWR